MTIKKQQRSHPTDHVILRDAVKITRDTQPMSLKCWPTLWPHPTKNKNKLYRGSKTKDNHKLHYVADEVLAAITMCQNDKSSIRELFVTPKQPNKHHHLFKRTTRGEDLTSKCTVSTGSVLGIDRTFNLGPCFVTTYTNWKVVKRETFQRTNNDALGWIDRIVPQIFLPLKQ